MEDGDDTGGTDGASGAQGPAAPGAGAEEDFRALAEDWIAIWQSEITAYLTDPETQASWAAIIALWAEAAQAMLRAMPAAPARGTPARGTPARGSAARDRGKPSTARHAAGADAAPGPAAAAAASDPRDDEVRRLEQRVAELERHLAGREGPGKRAAPGGDRRPGGPRRRRG